MGKWITKSYIIWILLITILTGPIVAKAQEEPWEAVISEVLKDERTKQFLNENKLLIESLQDQKERIRYSLEPYNEYPFQFKDSKGMKSGIFLQMIQLFEQLTQVKFQQVREVETKEEMLAKLESQEINLLLGLTMSKQVKKEFATQHKYCKLVALDKDMFLDSFVLIGQVQEEYSEQMLPYYYWGCIEDQYVELANSELINHTVTYNSIQDLESAFEDGMIQGMFITQGLERYHTFLDQMEYTNIKNVSFKASKYYCIAKNDKTLDQLLAKMIPLYISLYQEYFINEIPALEGSRANNNLTLYTYLPYVSAAAIGLIFLTLIVLLIKRQSEKRKMLRILKLIPDRNLKEQEVLFVLIKKSKIRSKRYFRVFGLEQKHPKKTMQMHELTKRIGFDFKKHYEFLTKEKEKDFTSCFDLYIRGAAYSFEELGRYQEDVIVSKIYRKDK